jgi:hypothetical protein
MNKKTNTKPTLDYGKFSREKEKIDIAFNHIINNEYEYGPVFQKTEKKYSVKKIETSSTTPLISRLYFTFQIDKYDESGDEYVEIDSDNKILTRRITLFPKQKKPLPLILITVFSLLIAIIVIPWVLLNSDSADPLYKAGKVLWIKSEEPVFQKIVNYEGPDAISGKLRNWEITGIDDQNYLGLVKLKIINETANTITLDINEECAELLASNKKTYYPTNSLTKAYDVSKINKKNQMDFVPLWGTVELTTGTMVTGYLVFDLPNGVTFSRLRWIASDTVTINY